MTASLLLLALLAATPDQPAHVGVTSTRDLSLHEAIEIAIRENLELEIERSNEADAEAALAAAQAYTDMTFRWQPNYQARNTPAPSLLQASNGKLTEHYLTSNFAVHQTTPWDGAAFDVTFDNSRVSSADPFLGVNPFYLSQLGVTLTQPLLRNRKIDAARSLLLIRTRQTALSRSEVEIKLIDVVTRVQQAYWDLAAARENQEIQREAVDLARNQLERDRHRIAAGTLAQSEAAGTDAEIARRQDTWYASAAVAAAQENAFKQLLSSATGTALWNQELVPTDRESTAAADLDDVPAVVARALQLRPELKSSAIRQQINAIETRQNENLVKPQLNLVATYLLGGLAGKRNTTPDPITLATEPIVNQINPILNAFGVTPVAAPTLGTLPGYLLGGYGADLGNLFSGRYQTVQAGLQVDMTFRNRAAKAAVTQSVIAGRKEKLAEAQIQQAIQSEVRDALEGLAIARQRRDAATAGETAAKQKLDSEMRLFETGESTTFLSLTRQNDYSEARRRRLLAALEFNRAVARVQRATGTTLSENRLALQ